MTGPEGTCDGKKRPPPNAWGNWASTLLAGNAGSAPIGGRRETPSVIGRGIFSASGGNRESADGKEGGKSQYQTKRDSACTRGSTGTRKTKKKCGGREGGLANAGSAGAEWTVKEIKVKKKNEIPNR
jgi:hypothetical protein